MRPCQRRGRLFFRLGLDNGICSSRQHFLVRGNESADGLIVRLDFEAQMASDGMAHWFSVDLCEVVVVAGSSDLGILKTIIPSRKAVRRSEETSGEKPQVEEILVKRGI